MKECVCVLDTFCIVFFVYISTVVMLNLQYNKIRMSLKVYEACILAYMMVRRIIYANAFLLVPKSEHRWEDPADFLSYPRYQDANT